MDYDYLIVSIGARPNTFNTPGVTENCHFLKVSTVRHSEAMKSLIELMNKGFAGSLYIFFCIDAKFSLDPTFYILIICHFSFILRKTSNFDQVFRKKIY